MNYVLKAAANIILVVLGVCVYCVILLAIFLGFLEIVGESTGLALLYSLVTILAAILIGWLFYIEIQRQKANTYKP